MGTWCSIVWINWKSGSTMTRPDKWPPCNQPGNGFIYYIVTRQSATETGWLVQSSILKLEIQSWFRYCCYINALQVQGVSLIFTTQWIHSQCILWSVGDKLVKHCNSKQQKWHKHPVWHHLSTLLANSFLLLIELCFAAHRQLIDSPTDRHTSRRIYCRKKMNLSRNTIEK